MIKLLLGDCIEIMRKMEDKSVDAIICDPPYGTTACKWDTVIPFEPMWEQLKRITKKNGAIVLFGSQPFTSALVMSNPKMFKYEWIWDKHIPRNFINAKIMPMQKHENILVFCDGKTIYNPQMIKREKPIKVKNYSKKNKASSYKLNENGSNNKEYVYTYRNPDTIIIGCWEANAGKLHPTQKPVALMEYLIKTYTNERETVLDFTMGSGTTGVACLNTNRNFIGIEISPEYYAIAEKRIANTQESFL